LPDAAPLFYHSAHGLNDLTAFEVVASPVADLPGGVPDTIDALVGLINGAQKSVQVQMYEYTTSASHAASKWTTLDNALRKAAARGVQVQLLVDKTALKTGNADLTSLKKVQNFEVRVITIPQWSGGPIPYARVAHSKYMIIDGARGWVGSENWSQSYFTGCRNVGLTFQDPQTIAQLGQVFSQVWNSPYVSR